MNRDDVVPASTYPLRRHTFESSRTFAYASLGAITGTLPLPWVPDVVARRVRGTMLHDIASRHRVALMDEARELLVESWFPGLPKVSGVAAFLAAQAGRFATGRVLALLGPLAWLAPARNAIYTYALAHVFERYMETARVSRAVRIDVEEAKLIKKAVEKALMALVTVKSESPWKDHIDAPEELRSDGTKLVDGVILSIVSLPGWFVARLDAAFDDAWATVREA